MFSNADSRYAKGGKSSTASAVERTLEKTVRESIPIFTERHHADARRLRGLYGAGGQDAAIERKTWDAEEPPVHAHRLARSGARDAARGGARDARLILAGHLEHGRYCLGVVLQQMSDLVRDLWRERDARQKSRARGEVERAKLGDAHVLVDEHDADVVPRRELVERALDHADRRVCAARTRRRARARAQLGLARSR